MPTVNIVLVQPQIPQNTGNIARSCACTGAKLHIIQPMGFEINSAKLKRAGLDYWDKLGVTYYSGLGHFFEECKGEYFFFSTKAEKCYSDVQYPSNSYLFFGREDKGLPEGLLAKNYAHCVRLPMLNQLRSLNLANTVAVAVYEVFRQHNFAGLNQQGYLGKQPEEDI